MSPRTDASVSPRADASVSPRTDGSITTSYYRDIRPLLAENCVGCHRDGGIAPFPLETYEQVLEVGGRVAQATFDRIMPPFLADNSGQCQTFEDARWLSDDEIALIGRWADEGGPMGDPNTPPPTIRPLPTLDGEVRTLSIGVDYQPDHSTNDDYRCFLAEAPSASSYFATGYEVHPGNPSVVHHVIVYSPSNASAGNVARQLDAGDPAPGYRCFGGAGVDAFPVVLWAPGTGAQNFPAGTGVELGGGVPLVIQIHYNTGAGDGPDRTTVDLEVAQTATRARILPLANTGISIPPGLAEVVQSSDFDYSGLVPFVLPLRIYAAFPHMHTIGVSIEVERVTRAGEIQCLIDIPRWDFNWQRGYFYEQPIMASANDTLRMTCTYDSRSRRSWTTWGEGTEDEMCVNFFYVVIGSGL